MIAVFGTNSSDVPVVREFFELFKTPWEFYQEDKQYDVVLSVRCDAPKTSAKLTITYSTRSAGQGGTIGAIAMGCGKVLNYNGSRLPIYGDSIAFEESDSDSLAHADLRRPAVAMSRNDRALFVQVGYDLFYEVSVLLTKGQPATNAELPAMELHIAVLRDLIVRAGLCVVDIPPIPKGHRLIACLTHDVDHPSVCAHFFDHTMVGFLYRASVGSVLNLLRRRGSFKDLISNYAAIIKLPFAFIGLASDTWNRFDEYNEIEKGLGSSFYIIPFKNTCGRRVDGDAPRQRASRYGAADISMQIRNLRSAGCEIGLHGIDTWLDAANGRAELREIRKFAGSDKVGARMHWLYFDSRSPAVLEDIGIEYDTTVGYNETIGYRAGTTQVYKPLSVARLLELPLHVMDTALFFPSYLDLPVAQAQERVDRIVDNAVQFGGCVTINWHDRSIAPERLWGKFYVGLVQKLKDEGAWFPTAAQAVSWFRKRRSAVFEKVVTQSGRVIVTLAVDLMAGLPDLQLRVYSDKDKVQCFPIGAGSSGRAPNKRVRRTIEAHIPLRREPTSRDEMTGLRQL